MTMDLFVCAVHKLLVQASLTMMLRSKALWLPGIVLLLLLRMMSLSPVHDLAIPDHDDHHHDFEEPPKKRVEGMNRFQRTIKEEARTDVASVVSITATPQQPQPTTTPTMTMTPPTSQETNNQTRRRLCESDEITNGQWVPLTLPRRPYTPISPRVRCPPPKNNHGPDYWTPFPTFVWQPQPCDLTPWNPSQLLRLLHNQTLLLVGDSTTLEHYGSLVHMLGDMVRLPPRAVRRGRITRYICHPHNRNKTGSCSHVKFHTDFHLTNMTEALTGHAAFPTVLVLNRGAHYQPDDQVLEELKTKTLPALVQWNDQCQRHFSSGLSQHQNINNNNKCRLIWRTTVPGHPYCGNFTQPATNVTEMEQWIFDKSTKDTTLYRKGEYHWHDFQHQNKFITHLLLETWTPVLTHVTITIMDSYIPNILRPDNHRARENDCLHTCSPGGGSDLNTQWLLHILLLLQQQQQQGNTTTNNNNDNSNKQ
jgi:GDSL/SGNH-like Acyl-Esterase family found in Pmr5 and Cas1p